MEPPLDARHDAAASRPPAARRPHVCPWWLGYALASPLRRLVESPERMLGPYLGPGMTVVEPGCGMGFFSLPIARMIGPTGTLVCVDVQPRMIDGLLRRARRAGLAGRIHASVCAEEDLGLAHWRTTADVAVAIHMIHEARRRERLLAALHDVLRPGGTLVIVEPRGHVSAGDFAHTLEVARDAGFSPSDQPAPRRGLAAVLTKPDTPLSQGRD